MTRFVSRWVESPTTRRASHWVTAIAAGAMLTIAGSASAVPPGGGGGDGGAGGGGGGGGGDGPDDCVFEVTGSVSANPPTIDVRSGVPLVTTLTWSITRPPNCPGVHGGAYINGLHVGSYSGSTTVAVNPHGTTTFSLAAGITGGTIGVASTRVVVTPALVSLSAGNQVTPGDVQAFDDWWMYPSVVAQALSDYRAALQNSQLGWVWDIGERMQAMIHMYEITHATRYLDHLRDIIEIALTYRDDRRSGFVHFDVFRPDWPTPMPAWGQGTAETAFYWTTSASADLAGVLSYPIAAFARIVAEDPALQGTYGPSALGYTNAVLDTFEAYQSRWASRVVNGYTEMYMQSPTIMSVYLTQQMCAQAEAVSGDVAAYNRCVDYGAWAGNKEPHNVEHLQAMTAMELFRALNSNFYRQSQAHRPDADAARTSIPPLVAGNQRFFADSLWTTHGVGSSDPAPPFPAIGDPRFVWNYMVDSPRPHIEDTSHAAVSMRYLSVLRDNQVLLNINMPANGGLVSITNDELTKFANTFLDNVLPGDHFAHDVSGRAVSGDENRDRECSGWLNLSVVDPRVYEKCAAVTLRIESGNQPTLGVVNHAALLKNKQYRAP